MGSIDKLLIYDATQSRSTTHVFIARPSPAEDRALGQLGFVAELAQNERIYHELLSRLQDFIKAAYYTSPEVHANVAFEHTVQACNRYIGELAADFGTAWLDSLSMVLFTVRDHEVHFTDVGGLLGFLIHDKHVIDLLGNQRAANRKVNPLKVFTSIASGSLKGSDAIFFSTANLLDYFSVERVRRTIVEAPLGGAARQFETVLRVDPTHAAFAAVILQSTAVPAPQRTVETQRQEVLPGAPQKSMEAMLAKTAQTQALLTPSVWPALQRWMKHASLRFRILFRAWVLRKPTRISPALERSRPEEEPAIRARTSYVASPAQPREVGRNIRRTVFHTFPRFLWERSRQALRATPKLLSAVQRLANVVRRAPQQLPTRIEQRVADVQSLPRRSRVLFYGTVAVAIVFAISLIIIGAQRQRSAAAKTNQETVAAITQNIEQATSSIIYGDEDRARTLLREAQDKLNGLPEKALKAEERTRLTDNITSVLAQTRHEVAVTPQVVATLPDGVQPVGLALLGGTLYTVDGATNRLFGITTSTGNVQQSVTLPGTAGLQDLTTYGSGSLVALTPNFEVIEQRPAVRTGTRSALTLPEASANLVGFASYNAALYTVDVANSAILRATRSGTSFRAALWLKQEVDLANTADIAVDGSIYVLTNSGEVLKLSQGRRETLALSTIEPPLSAAKKIAGGVTLQNLYVLDPSTNRVVVYTKNGKFVNQYTHTSLGTASALTVDERTQKIYFVIGATIQRIDLQKS